MQQWYQCPSCGAPVAFGVRFCGNCGTQLNWPTQQQMQPPPSYQQSQQQRSYEYGQARTKQRRTSSWLIVSIAFIVVVLLVGGAIFAINAGSQGTSPATSTPAETPLPEPEEEPVLSDMVVKLDELPTGWYQAAFQEDMTGEYVIDGVRVVFRNKKYATPEEEISVANSVSLCAEKQAAIYLISQEKPHFENLQSLPLGDDGFYGERMDTQCDIQFVKGLYLVQLEYYGQPLSNVSSEEKLAFLKNLAKNVELRIPTTQQAELPVIKNTDASKLALTLNDVQSDGFVIQDEAKPTEPDSISAHIIVFSKGNNAKALSNSVATYPTVLVAERHYNDLKFNCKDTIVGTVAVGDKGFLKAIESQEPNQRRYELIFQKNNVVVTIGGLTDSNKTEVYARTVEARIH